MDIRQSILSEFRLQRSKLEFIFLVVTDNELNRSLAQMTNPVVEHDQLIWWVWGGDFQFLVELDILFFCYGQSYFLF
jgi:hypothetical protein